MCYDIVQSLPVVQINSWPGLFQIYQDGARMTGGHFPGHSQHGPVRMRTRHPEMVAGARARNVMRYSGDFDMVTNTRSRGVMGGQGRHQMNNVFR